MFGSLANLTFQKKMDYLDLKRIRESFQNRFGCELDTALPMSRPVVRPAVIKGWT